MVLAYALATAVSGRLARGGGPGSVLVRTGHVGTGIEGLSRSRFDFEIRVTASAREGRKEGAKNIRPYCHTCRSTYGKLL